MKKISILIPDEAVMASVVDPRTIFLGANDFLRAMGRAPVFDVQLVGLVREMKVSKGAFSIHADALLHEVTHTDLVIIPAIGGNLRASIAKNEAFLPWIIGQYRNGAEVASLCVGAFLLAATGLLNGKQCSSHWKAADEFRALYPEVTLTDDRIVKIIARDAHRFADGNIGQRNDGDLGRAAADIDDHAGRRFGDRQPRADRGGHRFFDEVHAARTGALGAVEHRAFFNRGNA